MVNSRAPPAHLQVMDRTTGSKRTRIVTHPASDKQVRLIHDLLAERIVPNPLLRQVDQALDLGASITGAHRLIPRLLACEVRPPVDDWTTPEGYDDSPDQGVHRHDGGGTFW